MLSKKEVLAIDRSTVWHPYSPMPAASENFLIASASGVKLQLEDGPVLIDGMSSWWTAIHGYNHPRLNRAAISQINKMSHVMFGGLTHRPAVELAKLLTEITPTGLDKVFFSDSGSVGIEVAMKLALQFWISKEQSEKNKFVTVRKGYHGDTLHAMSVCDPVGGMHSMFKCSLPEQIFLDAPPSGFNKKLSKKVEVKLKEELEKNKDDIAAFIIEPIVQGAGGMRFYCPDYLKLIRKLCSEFNILFICDEIATGFGRSGKLFACEHADISPDIMVIGKALTGGYMSLAATLCNEELAETVSQNSTSCLMHGPTFMANPLACSVALESVKMLLESDWESEIKRIESGLLTALPEAVSSPHIREKRCLGAIGVIELESEVDIKSVQEKVIAEGVWLRPFRNLLYTMPPYITSDEDIERIGLAMRSATR